MGNYIAEEDVSNIMETTILEIGKKAERMVKEHITTTTETSMIRVEDSKKYGQGTMYINGDKYIAQWDWNKGQGEINYKDGTKYISSSTTGSRLNSSSGAATVSINKISVISICNI